jgi:hypothetical protein
MWTVLGEVLFVLAAHGAGVPLVVDQNPAAAVGPDFVREPFGLAVRPWCPRRGLTTAMPSLGAKTALNDPGVGCRHCRAAWIDVAGGAMDRSMSPPAAVGEGRGGAVEARADARRGKSHALVLQSVRTEDGTRCRRRSTSPPWAAI